MRDLVIQSLGAFTPVGINVPQTMGSIYTRVQLFSETTAVGEDGEPVVGAPAPDIDQGADGSRRLVTMAALALRECAGRDAAAVAVFLCLPATGSLDQNRVLADLERESGVPFDVQKSQIIHGAHVAVIHALRAAASYLEAGRADSCYVGGADSLLEPSRLEALIDQRRIKSEINSDGFVPGEGAVFLRLTTRARPDSLAVIAGFGTISESSAQANQPITGITLTRVIRQVLAAARISVHQIGLVVHDISGRRAAFRELALTVTRLRFKREQTFDSWSTAVCVGEIGAANGPLSLAVAAFFLHIGVSAVSGAMFVCVDDEGERGAICVLPNPKKGSTHG